MARLISEGLMTTQQPDRVEGVAHGEFPATMFTGNASGSASPPKPPARDEDSAEEID